MTPGAFPHRGTAAPFRVAIGLALAAGAGTMLWGVGTHSLAFASEFGRNAARETPMTLEDRVAALTAELAQVKAETAKLRESQGDTSEELSHMRASLANAECSLSDNLRLIRHFEKGGSGSSGLEFKRPAVGAASDGLRWWQV
jgi:hypothetical protein